MVLMKIGILTYHRAYNYGAILQAFALQKKLSRMGCDSTVIDYLNIEKRIENKLFYIQPGRSTKDNLLKLFKDIYRFSKNKKFDNFIREQMVLSDVSYSTYDEMCLMDLDSEYDCYIVGSDQVWNINNNKRDRVFLLSFCTDNSKRCSYAASVGNATFDKEMHDLYMKELSKFRVLSVREESSIKEFDFLWENNAEVALDPTLLLDEMDYINIASPRLVKKRYAFLYTIEEERNLRNYARWFCKNNKIILIDSKRSLRFFANSDPRDFLSFILHADYVFTNSFHGTVFSIILKKQFVTEVYTKHRLNNRSADLLYKLGLSSRDLEHDSFNINCKVDYSMVEAKISELRKTSLDILQRIVEGSEQYE